MVHCGYEATAVDFTFSVLQGAHGGGAGHADGQAMTVQPERRVSKGWSPEIGDATALAEVIERAFDYRGDVTIVRRDGTEIVGYLFNRDATVAQPFVQVFDAAGRAAR